MEKQYDRKCVKCESCHWFEPEGKRESTIDPDAIWPEACAWFGTAFHEYEPTEDCAAFMTEEGYKTYVRQEKIKKKYSNNKR